MTVFGDGDTTIPLQAVMTPGNASLFQVRYSAYNDSMPDYVSYSRTVQGNLTSRVNLLLMLTK